MKITVDLDPELYRAVKVEAARADRSVRDVLEEAVATWLERTEADEDRASADAALAEYRRDGGESAAAFFEHLAAEARATYGTAKAQAPGDPPGPRPPGDRPEPRPPGDPPGPRPPGDRPEPRPADDRG